MSTIDIQNIVYLKLFFAQRPTTSDNMIHEMGNTTQYTVGR